LQLGRRALSGVEDAFLPDEDERLKAHPFRAAGTERQHQEEALSYEIPRNPLKNSNRFWPGSPFGDREHPTGLRAGLARHRDNRRFSASQLG